MERSEECQWVEVFVHGTPNVLSAYVLCKCDQLWWPADQRSLIQQQVGVHKPLPHNDFPKADVETALEHGA